MNTKKIEIQKPITPSIAFNEKKLNHRDHIYEAIKNKVLNFEISKCFCNHTEGETIDNYDAWGLNIPTIICNNCHSMRSKFFLNDISIHEL